MLFNLTCFSLQIFILWLCEFLRRKPFCSLLWCTSCVPAQMHGAHWEIQTCGCSEQHLHRHTKIKCTHGKKELNKFKRQWLTLMKLTNKGDIDGLVQLLLSLPPSLMFDPVDVKAGCSTKEPVWTKHHFLTGELPRFIGAFLASLTNNFTHMYH